METTRKQRRQYESGEVDAAPGNVEALCRDVDTLKAALRETTLCLEAVLITVDLIIGSGVPGEGRKRADAALVSAREILDSDNPKE